MQPDLFTHDLALPVSGRTAITREASRQAAIKAESKTFRQRLLILGAIRLAGDEGRTDKELQALLDMDGNSERPRRIELWKAGQIQPMGKRDGCTIWVVRRG